jgi:hypothetical protein
MSGIHILQGKKWHHNKSVFPQQLIFYKRRIYSGDLNIQLVEYSDIQIPA